jgi:hypothetical protein
LQDVRRGPVNVDDYEVLGLASVSFPFVFASACFLLRCRWLSLCVPVTGVASGGAAFGRSKEARLKVDSVEATVALGGELEGNQYPVITTIGTIRLFEVSSLCV